MLPLAVLVDVNVNFLGEQFTKRIDAKEYEHASDDSFESCFGRLGDLKL